MISSINGTRMVFTLEQPPISLPPTITVAARGTYNVTWIPNVVRRSALPNARVFTTYNEPVDVDIGFNFVFYGTPYSSITITANGVVQFVTNQYVYDPQPIPNGNSGIYPFLAFGYSYQLYYAYYNERTYATFGNPGNRTFVIRYDNAFYSYDQPGYASIDLWLFEIDNHIEIRFYQVDHTYQQTFLVGMQASNIDYAVAYNATVLTPAMAMMLSYSTVVIQGVNPIPTVELRRIRYSVTQTGSVPTRNALSNPVYPFSVLVDDGVTNPISIGFAFPFYGINYTTLTLSSNGNIQFGTRYTGFATTPLPLQIRAAMPMISYAFTNLVVRPSDLSYESAGSSPNRYFIIRLNNVFFYYQSPVGNITMDCLLFENGNIEMRYYAVSPTWQGMVIGLESRRLPDGNSDYTIFMNNDPLLASAATALTGTTIVFSVASNVAYTAGALEPIVPRGFGYGTYNVSLRAGTAPYLDPLPGASVTYLSCCVYYLPVQLGFGFVFMGRNYTSAFIDVYGRIGFRTGSYTTLSAAMPFGNSPYTPLISIFWSQIYAWQNNNLVSYATYGTPGSRYFILRFKNVPYSVSPYTYTSLVSVDTYLYEADGRIEMHYYRVDAMSDTVLIGVQGSTTSNGTLNFAYLHNDGAINTATAAGLVGKTAVFQIASGVLEITPIPISYSTYNVRQVRGAPVIDMSGASYLGACDDCVNTVTLPFTFSFFNVNYTQVRVSSNGNLQWATSSTQYSVNPLPDGNPNVEPLLAVLMTDLYPNGANVRSYKTFGISPNRYFVVSFNLTGFCCSIGGTYRMASFDIILYETTNAIEIRYRRIDAGSNYVVIGVDDARALSNGEPDYTVLVNVGLLTQTLVDRLVNTSVFFEYAPPRPSSSSSTGVAFMSSSSSSPIVSISSSISSSRSSSSSSTTIPSVSSSSSAETSILPSVCIPRTALPLVAHTIEMVFNTPLGELRNGGFMETLLNAIRSAINNAVFGANANDQIKCGILRSASSIVTNIYFGQSTQSVATIYVQNATVGVDPRAVRNALVSIITTPGNSINSALLQNSYPPASTELYGSYKTCQNGNTIEDDQLCLGETGSSSSDSTLGSGAIAGIVIGVIIGVALLLVILFVILRSRGGKFESSQFHDDDDDINGGKSSNKMHRLDESEESTAHYDEGVELAATNRADTDDVTEDGEHETQEFV
jgi:hypothetical protein